MKEILNHLTIWKVKEPIPDCLEGRTIVICAGALNSTKDWWLIEPKDEIKCLPSSIDGMYKPEYCKEMECIGTALNVGLRGILKHKIRYTGFPYPIYNVSVSDDELKAYFTKVRETVTKFRKEVIQEIDELEKRIL